MIFKKFQKVLLLIDSPVYLTPRKRFLIQMSLWIFIKNRNRPRVPVMGPGGAIWWKNTTVPLSNNTRLVVRSVNKRVTLLIPGPYNWISPRYVTFLGEGRREFPHFHHSSRHGSRHPRNISNILFTPPNWQQLPMSRDSVMRYIFSPNSRGSC